MNYICGITIYNNEKKAWNANHNTYNIEGLCYKIEKNIVNQLYIN